MAGLRGLVLFLLACAVFAKDKPVIVTAKLEWEASGLSGAPALKLPMTDSVLAGITPPKGLRKGLYGTLKLGKREFAIALDLSMSRPRTWIDSDGDNDLSDETSSTWSASGTRFEKVATIPIPVEGEADLVPVQIRLYRLQNCKPDHIHLFPQIHRRGSAILGGRVRAVALVDGNSDLSFDDEKQDRLYVDLDGDGRLDTRADSPELVLPGKAFRAGSRGYVAKLVSPAGHAVEFHPKSPAPPAPRRTWTARAVPQAGAKPKRPRESLRTLKKRFEREWGWEEVRRYGTVRLIGAVGSEDSFKFLVQIVNEDRSRLVRREAARAMGNRHYKPDHGHVTELAKKHAETIVRAAALDALHGMDAPFRQELYFELIRKSDQPTIVLACAKNLAYIGTGEAEMGVVSAAHDRGTPILRYQCYLGTQYFKAGPPLALARKSARDKYAPLRAAGIRDLHMMGREEAVGYARDAAKERPVQLTLALAAIEVLGVESDAPTIHTLLGLVEANNGRVTERLRAALGPNRTPCAIEAFLGALKSKEPAVRALSAEILAAIPDKRTTEKLLRLARKEKNEVALVAVLEALGDHEDPRALDTLLKIARSKDKVRRAAASRALARIGVNHPRVRRFFLRLFKSAIWQDRIFALDAAAAVGDASVAGNVIANLDHKQWPVRLAAVQALRSTALRRPSSP
ncbi:MAG: HEAT repeat domain-containing protein [Planctomycetota bacterium]|nr:HEAT repeat domain-containing protein [Planctomycetota bacterium]